MAIYHDNKDVAKMFAHVNDPIPSARAEDPALPRGFDEIIQRVEAVTEEEVMAMAGTLFQSERVALTLLGRLDGLHLNRSQLVC